MPELDFQFVSAVQVLDGGVLLGEPISMPGVSLIEDEEKRFRRGLDERLRHELEAWPLGTVYRDRQVGTPRCVEVTLEIAPARRQPAWIEPVRLRFHVVRWEHGGAMHLAYVPALGIGVLAETAEALDERLPEHIRFALLRTKATTSLRALAAVQRCQEVRLAPTTVRVNLRTPKQAATEERSGRKAAKPVLPEVGLDLTKADLLPAFDADQVVRQLAEALGGNPPCSVLLVGPSGVGKTAAMHELVRRRAEFQFGETPFWASSGSRLVAGMTGFGMWQARCQQVVREASKTKAVLHLGPLGELLQVGRSVHSSEGIASFLRPALGRGELLAVVECTPEQLPLIERQDPHLLDVFHRVTVDEPDHVRSRSILAQVARDVRQAAPGLDDDALDTLDRLHRRYATYSAYPGRPVRFLRNLLADHAPGRALDAQQVTALFSRETGLPLFMLDDAVPLDLEATRAWFAARVMGQTEAVSLVVDLLATVKARLARPRKPLASFLFIGPTGVGKTEMAKALAQFLFGSRERMVRHDLSEFADPLAVRRLVGGLDGAEGLLTARVRDQPFCVVLLDEFEKAHPLLFDLLLQVLGEGRLTDDAGRLADFTNTVVVMTSNLGAQTYHQTPLGFVVDADAARNARQHFEEAVERFLRPEMFKRIDAVVPFAPLDEPTALAIVRRELELVRQRDGVQRRPISLVIGEAVERHLAARGFDPALGARPLKRAIERELLAPLADTLSRHPSSVTLAATVDLDQGRLRVAVHAQPEFPAALVAEPQLLMLAEAVTGLRRTLQRLRRGGIETELENRLAMGESLARRIAGGRRPTAKEQDQLDRLPRLKTTFDGLTGLHREAGELESEVLLAFHEKANLPTAPVHHRLQTLQQTLDDLLRWMLWLELDRPDALVLAVYSDNPTWLFELGAAYRQAVIAAGHRVQVEQVLPSHAGRNAGPNLLRQVVPKPAEFLATPVAGVLGLVFAIDGFLAWPRWEEESGRHALKEQKLSAEAVVETANVALADYPVPEAAARPGGLTVSGRCRTYDRVAEVIDDAHLGRRVSKLDNLGRSVSVCVDDRFEERVSGPIAA